MIITEKDREHLMKELEKLTGKRPLFHLKFCSMEKYAEDVCDGKLFSNTPKHFREQELASGERGQGDQYELLSIIEAQRITMCDSETGEIVLVAPKGSLRVQFKEDDSIPIVSFVGIPLSDMILEYADETHADFLFPFTEEEYCSMSKIFGEYCVMLNRKELENHIQEYCRNNRCEYVFDKIEYCEQNRIDRIQAFNKSAKERFLYKNKDLAYQREYRLAIAREIPEDHFINIGTMNNTKILKSNQLKGVRFSIEYVSHIINDEEK